MESVDVTMWEDWEDIREEEINACFNTLPSQIDLKCEFEGCNEMFDSSRKLRLHINKHHGGYKQISESSVTDEEISRVFKTAVLMAKRCKIDFDENPSYLAANCTKSLIVLFKNSKSLDKFYSEYSKMCIGASELLGIPQSSAALLLIKLFDAIVKTYEEIEQQKITSGMDFREVDILEYMGGYLIRKISQRYGNSLVKHICADEPRGDFLKVIQKKPGTLFYPTLQFLGILQRVYWYHNKEVAKNVNAINFYNILDSIQSDPFFHKLITSLAAKSDLDEECVEDCMNEVICFFIQILGHNFAKYMLSKCKKQSSKFVPSLRQSLKKS